MVVACGEGRAGDEQIVDRHVVALGGGLRVGERHVEGAEGTRQRSRGPHRAEGGVADLRLAERRAGHLERRAARPDDRRRVDDSVDRALDRATRHTELATGDVGHGVADRAEEGGIVVGDRCGLDGGALGRVALEVDEFERQAESTLAVGDRVVEALHHGRLAAAESVDHHELPQGSGAVERVHEERRREPVEVGPRAPTAQGDVLEVVVEVEVGIDLPLRRRQPPEHRGDPLAETREDDRGPLEGRPHPVEVGGPVEDRHVGDVARQARVLFEVPHQGLEVGHVAVVGAIVRHRLRLPAGDLRECPQDEVARWLGRRGRTRRARRPSAHPTT